MPKISNPTKHDFKTFVVLYILQWENRRMEKKMLVKFCGLARTFALHIFERKLVLQVK